MNFAIENYPSFIILGKVHSFQLLCDCKVIVGQLISLSIE